MSQPIAYGIDLGTSNSSIAVAYPSRVDSLGTLTDPGVPSMLYLDDLNHTLVGNEAAQQYMVRLDPAASRLMSSLKLDLATPPHLTITTKAWGRTWDLEDLTGLILGDLKKRADKSLDADVRRVVIGHPAVFAGAEGDEFQTLQELALTRLKEAARLAGFEQIRFLDEPTAALKHHDDLKPNINVALDFGAGTFDVSVIHYDTRPNTTDVLATHGVAVGGNRFDGAVFDRALHERLGFDDLRFADSIRDARTTVGMLWLVRDWNARGRLMEYAHRNHQSGLRTLRSILEAGQAYALSKAVEDAKCELSKHHNASVELIRPGQEIAINEAVRREDFEESISDDLDQVFEVLDKTLQDADITAQEVRQVVLTGGSCLIPAFRQRIRRKFGADRVRYPSTTGVVKNPDPGPRYVVASRVALGLASEARELWS